MSINHASLTGDSPAFAGRADLDQPEPVVFRRMIRAILNLFRKRRDYQHLMDLPDYLLDDIGLSRTDVLSASLGHTPERLKRH